MWRWFAVRFRRIFQPCRQGQCHAGDGPATGGGWPAARPRPLSLLDGGCPRLEHVRLPRNAGGIAEAIAGENRGVFVYLHHTGRGFRIDSRTEEGAALPKIIYHHREHVERDPGVQRVIQHESGIGAQILKDLGLAANPRPDEPAAQSCGARRLRIGDCGSGPA